MIAHFTKMAFKAFWRFKLHSAINMLSLVFGFFCFIVATLLANYLNNSDQHFPASDRTYYIAEGDDGSPRPYTVGRPLTKYMRIEFPELEYIAKAMPVLRVDITADGKSDSLRVRYVESDFLKIFPIPILKGIETGSSLAPNTALISENSAIKQFGTTDVVGKILILEHEATITIAGVTKRFEYPSHIESGLSTLSSDLIVPIEVSDQINASRMATTLSEADADLWRWGIFHTYVQFPPGSTVDTAAFQAKLDLFAEKVVPKIQFFPPRKFSLQPINQLMKAIISGSTGGVDITLALNFTGAMVLLIACLNYSNLVIAQLALRSQEIGVQKILGAKRLLLIAQYSYEGLLFVLAALLTALFFSYLTLLNLTNTGIPGLRVEMLLNVSLWMNIALAVSMIIVASGAYPALRTLRGTLVTLLRPRGSVGYSGGLRALMVGTQFMISGTLIIVSLTMFTQNQTFMEQLDGNAVDPKIAITVPLDKLAINPELLSTELLAHTGISSTTVTGDLPWSGMVNLVLSLSRSPELDAPAVRTINRAVDYNFFETFDVPLVAGRSFSKEHANDVYPSVDALSATRGPYSTIIDEATVKRLGFSSAEEAIGQTIYRHLEPPTVASPTVIEQVIIGVASQHTFQIADYTQAFGGNAYHLEPARLKYMIVRVSLADMENALAHIDEVWNRLLPDTVLNRQFADELFFASYQLFITMNKTITALSILGFLIASFGLLGNATFITNIRQKEVGIRKTMGASSARLLRMLLLDFSKPVIIANIIAWPIGFIFAKGYISLFALQSSITITPFLISFALSFIIACISVGSQSWKSARIRPAMILRYE